MDATINATCTAFSGSKQVATGCLKDVAVASKKFALKDPKADLLIFDDQTGRVIDVDLRGSVDAVTRRFEETEIDGGDSEKKAGPGRPKLGVVAREVTLLPQHWEWLASQPGGASVTLRKLVEDAKKKYAGRDELRRAQEATYRFMTAMAGDFPDYEEALRAFYAKDAAKFKKLVKPWPSDVRDHILKMAKTAL